MTIESKLNKKRQFPVIIRSHRDAAKLNDVELVLNKSPFGKNTR